MVKIFRKSGIRGMNGISDIGLYGYEGKRIYKNEGKPNIVVIGK